jgi:hypothetical protein
MNMLSVPISDPINVLNSALYIVLLFIKKTLGPCHMPFFDRKGSNCVGLGYSLYKKKVNVSIGYEKSRKNSILASVNLHQLNLIYFVMYM